MKKNVILAAVLLTGLFLFFSFSSITSSRPQDNKENPLIKYGVWSTADGAALNVIAWVAYDKGFFEKHGLNVELVSMPQPLIGLNSGSIDVMTAGPSASTQAAIQGATNFRFIATIQKNSPSAFISSKPANEVRTIALSEQSPINMVLILRMLDKLGIEEEDVNFLALGDPQNQFVALLDGRVDAFVTHTGIFLTLSEKFKEEVEEKDIKILYDFINEEKPISPKGIFANADYIKQNPQNLQKILEALREANEFLIKNPDEVYKLFAKRTDQQEEDVKLHIDVYIKGVKAGEVISRPDVIAIESVREFLAKNDEKARDFNPQGMMDYSIIDRVLSQ